MSLAAPRRSGEALWPRGRLLLLMLALAATLLALGSWFAGDTGAFLPLQTSCLLAAIVVLNLAPFTIELFCRRLDPLDAKHPFLAYFFLIFTLHCVYAVMFDGVVNPALSTPEPSAVLRVRALSAILLGLAAFVAGCYLSFGRRLAQLLPSRPLVSPIGVRIVAVAGIVAGTTAFFLLMVRSGGVASFLRNLGTWRTAGVLEGVGYLTFPISIILPAAALLWLLHTLPPAGRPFTWRALGATGFALASLGPIAILGFRGALLPAVLQFVMAWHYFRRRLSVGLLLAFGLSMIVLLTFYALVRNEAGDDRRSDYLTAVLFRVTGLDNVERVVWRLDLGEPHRGIKPVAIEAATIVVPRAIWPAKPEAGSLAFADIFFFDFFLGRGDPIHGIRSGVTPTLIGEALWVGGLTGVFLAALGLGLAARTAAEWRQRGGRNVLHVFIYAIFMSMLPVFVEAPQNGLNAICMVAVLTVGIWAVVARRDVPRADSNP